LQIGWRERVRSHGVEGYSSHKTVTSEFVQPKKSILWFRNNKFYFSFKKLINCVVSRLFDSFTNYSSQKSRGD